MTGIVVAIDEQSCKVRVQFPDLDDLVSDWLPVLQEFCVGNQAYRLPDLDNQVACLMDANYEAGIVLGAIYSDADPPPVTDANLYHIRFKDGTVIEYDRAGHMLTANVLGDIEITATGSITSTSPTWTHNGDLVVNGDIQASGEVSDGVRSMAADRLIFNAHKNAGLPLTSVPM